MIDNGYFEAQSATFWSAYYDIGNGRPYVAIHEIRERLCWDREVFDAVLAWLAKTGEIELTGGDPSKLTFAQIADSYVDSNGHDLYSVCWRGGENGK